MKTESPFSKTELREKLLKIRGALDPERREDAGRALVSSLVHLLSSFDHVLSFVSFNGEIDTTLINLYLSRTERLVLPKMGGQSLEIYKVTDYERQLKAHPLGILEPDAKRCERIMPETIDLALIPGVGFDRQKQRIGYGKGYYDRFLATIPHCQTMGLGFKEQLVEVLPTEAGDHPLDEIALF